MRDGLVLNKQPRVAVADAESSPLVEVVEVNLGGKTERGVIAKRDIAPGTMLCQYRGEHRSQNDFESCTYVMAGVGVDGETVYIDGDTSTLAANINYAPSRHANVSFEDRNLGKEASAVWAVATRPIPAGQELRVDYDGYSGARGYRSHMVAKGVATEAQLDDPAFLRARYAPK